MKRIHIIIWVTVIALGIIASFSNTPSYIQACHLDKAQYALDKAMPTAQPLVRQLNITAKHGSGVLYTVEFQYGKDNDHPHVAMVIWYSKDNNEVNIIQ